MIFAIFSFIWFNTVARRMIYNMTISAFAIKSFHDRTTDLEVRVTVLHEITPLHKFAWVEKELREAANRDLGDRQFTDSMNFALEEFEARARVRERAER